MAPPPRPTQGPPPKYHSTLNHLPTHDPQQSTPPPPPPLCHSQGSVTRIPSLTPHECPRHVFQEHRSICRLQRELSCWPRLRRRRLHPRRKPVFTCAILPFSPSSPPPVALGRNRDPTQGPSALPTHPLRPFRPHSTLKPTRVPSVIKPRTNATHTGEGRTCAASLVCIDGFCR